MHFRSSYFLSQRVLGLAFGAAVVTAAGPVLSVTGFAAHPTSAAQAPSEPWTWEIDEAVTIGELAPPYPPTMNIVWPAREVLIDGCMGHRGYPYDPLPAIDFDASWKASLDASLLLPENAAAYGYSAPIVADPPEVVDAWRQLEARAANIRGYLLALGAQAGEADELGCSIIAGDTLDLGLAEENAALNAVSRDAEAQVVAAVDADAAYRRALDAWVACMGAEGHDYANPDEPWSDPRWVNAPVLTDDERATALDDSACRVESGYNDAMRAAQRTAVAAWVADHAELIAELQQADAALRQRAQTVLDDR